MELAQYSVQWGVFCEHGNETYLKQGISWLAEQI